MAGSGSVLTILAAEIPDSGVFLCVANNGVPKAAPAEISQIFYLLVRRESLPHLFLNFYSFYCFTVLYSREVVTALGRVKK